MGTTSLFADKDYSSEWEFDDENQYVFPTYYPNDLILSKNCSMAHALFQDVLAPLGIIKYDIFYENVYEVRIPIRK